MKKITTILILLLVSALLAGTVSAGTISRDVGSGAAVFVYEDIAVDDTSSTSLIQYSDGPNPQALNVISGKDGEFQLTEEVVNGMYGTYYYKGNPKDSGEYVTIWYPEISLKAELTTGKDGMSTSGDSIDGKSINKNTNVSFKIGSPQVAPTLGCSAKLIFTTPSGGKTHSFGLHEFSLIRMNRAETITSPAAPGRNAEAGTWTVQAQYVTQPFKDYAKKSNTITFDVRSTSLTLTAVKDSVVRNNPFVVTIQGDSLAYYLIYLDGASETDVNPTLQQYQDGWQYDDEDHIGGAVFMTDASGNRNVQYNTIAETTDKTYTIKVEALKKYEYEPDPTDYDTTKVKVEKGAVTISATGDGSYFIGAEIKLTGTNTDSSDVYLFITGPNLATNGLALKTVGGTNEPAKDNTQPVSVKTDNTWEYKWNTENCGLDTGAYTIYAASRLTNGKSSSNAFLNYSYEATDNEKEYGTLLPGPGEGYYGYYAVKLSDAEYATVSVNLKTPFIFAAPSGTVIAKGDKVYIRGTAEGDPSKLQLYIFGPNKFVYDSITVEDDGSYEKKIDIGSDWASNQYYVVIEHPMYNNKIDVQVDDPQDPTELFIYNVDGYSIQSSFIVAGPGKLQGANAADALTKMIDSPNIDDKYTKLTFTVSEPWIKLVNPGDKAVGMKFTLSGTTNLAVDDQILVDVTSSSFSAVDKTQSSPTSGVSRTTKVVAGEGGDNTWSVEIDTTNWNLDEYTIKVSGIEVDISTSTTFNVVEKLPDTPTPTATGATAVPTGTTATATATPATPGFGAFVALAGLGAVALLVLRRT
ncbi:PGF-CTERM sorting domain-containing protein [Methanocorpusculum sp. MG]|uniref:PGF-CTERM sorting domain-containing protein n=1 Tax=Methanocorpusculum petauri TaxID=3002863 RepID=A0ABT4II31_9EURY|nr:PGF-CTERM sorting domain-containing protein [Methanocorpusculum petauri]MCZ0860748.1 PGF-CTERM sorting domain-containing protein [Methanocorpusculum petauri]